MPVGSTGRLCPICDSPLEEGAKKCSFCGTDLTMFEGEAKGALRKEDKLVKTTYPSAEPKPSPPSTPAEKIPEPKVEPVKPSEVSESTFECPACGGKVKESDKVCPNCGAIFDEEAQFECPACKTLVNADSTKCPGCGAIFLEEESSAAADSGVVKRAQPTIVAEKPTEPTETVKEKDEELDRIITAAKKMRDDKKKATEAEKKKPSRKGFGFFKSILPRGEPTPATEEAPKEKPVAEKTVEEPVKKPMKISDAAEPAATPAAVEVVAAPKRKWPTDPREQGKELARLVAEVRGILNTAMARGIYIDETKQTLDRAITAGRERQFLQALEIISEGQEKLHNKLREYVNATILTLNDEVTIAKKLGASPSRAEVFMKESGRAVGANDFQAALIFIDKAKHELAPVTGQYNEIKESLRKFERLVKDARVIGIDNEPLKKIYENAKASFDNLDFSKADSLIKKTTDEILSQIPERMGKEIEKAKQMLIDAKMKTEVGMAPQIAILKSAIRRMQEEKYTEALTELKHFKKEMRKLLSQV